MTPHAAIALAREHGVTIAVNGDRLKLSAPAEPPATVLSALQEQKAEVVALLRGSERRCNVCGTVLSNDIYLALWTGGDCCPSGPCLQQALDRADDDKETPKAVREFAERLSEEGP